MHKRVRVLLAALSLCAAVTALAADDKNTLYVKARNTRLMASAAPTADVVAILQPGQQVTWLGADAKNKQWHRVRVNAKKIKEGLVFQSNLSTKPPNMELTTKSGGSPIDPTAFANSGAAVKGLSDGAIAYGNGKKDPDLSQAVVQVQALEKLAEQITPAELAAHAAKARLLPVVGPRDTISRGGK
jgi:uncharacterized protein YgiM (DUF1202 family)